MPGQDNEGIPIWVFAGPRVPGITPCWDLEPTLYLGPKDGEAIPDEGAIYAECIDFSSQISGSGRILFSAATGNGNWPCAFGNTPPPTTAESDGAATASAAGAALLGLAAHLV